ncbi:hypothetical protein BC941DRAFT_439703 [Chlamydoabsidia padenii]|nr:hypothetical protein BC941DRAFT_439703 [Chlamydoabsidia padenii]
MSTYTNNNTDNNTTTNNGYSNTMSSIVTALMVFSQKRKHRLPYLFYGSMGIVIIIYCLYYLSLTSSSSSSHMDTNKVKPESVHVEYMDTSQLMNNEELQRLIFQDATDEWPMNSKSKTYGHSEQQLQELIQTSSSLPLPSVTALLQATPTAPFYTQLSAVLHQSSPPSTVWLVCHSIQHQTMLQQHTQSLPEKAKIHILLLQPGMNDNDSWMMFALQADSDYIWILEQGAVPGKGYLERLVRLSSTPIYKHNLLGTLGYDELDKCIETSGADFVTRPVHRLGGGLWLLHRSWLALDLLQPLSSPAQQSNRGRLISDYMNHIGITPVILPLSDPSQWHDVTRTKIGSSCPLQQQEQEQQAVESTTKLSSLVFLIDQVEQLQELIPLICHRALDPDNINKMIHLLFTQSTIGTKVLEQAPRCQSTDDPTSLSAHIVLHRPSDWLLYGDHHQQAWQMAQTLLYQLPSTMTRLGATVLIHTLRSTNPLFQTVASLSSLTSKQPMTIIGLPARDIRHVEWMMDLPMTALENWHTGNIQLVLTTDRNPYGLTRLLRSATKAHYMGDTVDLTIIMDQSSDRVTQRFVNDFGWNRGEKHLRHRIVKMNRMPLFVESWYPRNSDHDYAILLNDDLDLSPLYYIWAKQALLTYRYSNNNTTNNEMMMGISLYSPRLIDNHQDGRRLFSPETTGPYLMQTMTNGGTLVFPEHWREFHDYVTARYADIRKKQLQTIDVPLARSAAWNNSWRKYMDELMYMRGYVVLYPPHQNGYSTQYLDLPHQEDMMDDAVRGLFQVPLEQETIASPPPLSDLALYDLWGQLVQSHDDMLTRGRLFQTKVSACPPPTQWIFDPADLLCPFARIVDVPVDQATTDVLPTRVATLYVTHGPTTM